MECRFSFKKSISKHKRTYVCICAGMITINTVAQHNVSCSFSNTFYVCMYSKCYYRGSNLPCPSEGCVLSNKDMLYTSICTPTSLGTSTLCAISVSLARLVKVCLHSLPISNFHSIRPLSDAFTGANGKYNPETKRKAINS